MSHTNLTLVQASRRHSVSQTSQSSSVSHPFSGDKRLLDEKISPLEPYDFNANDAAYDPRDYDRRSSEPSLPIVLLSAAGGIAGGAIGLYVAYIALDLSLQLTAAITTLSLCTALGSTGALLSMLTGSRAAFGNIALSCGLVILATLFFSICTLAGAMTATLILTWGG